jgi:hypothetical protein
MIAEAAKTDPISSRRNDEKKFNQMTDEDGKEIDDILSFYDSD